MKLKSVLMMTAALSFGAVSAQQTAGTAVQAPTLTDVPAGHWARDAVERLVAQGIILGYPDGTFRGAQNITRYEAALIISRLLDLIAQGTVTITDPQTNVSVQNAIQELAADLAALGVRVADMEENAASREDIARLEARINQLAAGVVPGEAGDDTMASDLAVIAGNLESMSELIIVLSDDVRDLSARVAALEAAADAAPAQPGEAAGTEIDVELVTRLETVLVNYDEVVGRIDAIDESIAALNDLSVLLNEDILSLQDRVAAIEGDLVTRAEFTALQTQVTGINNTVLDLNRGRVTFGLGATTLNYRAGSYLEGNLPFDVDRLTAGTFAAGRFSNPNVGADVTDADFPVNTTGLSVGAFTIGVRNLATAGALTISEASVGIGVFAGDRNATLGQAPYLTLSNINVRGTLAGNGFSAVYAYGPQAVRFNDYFYRNDRATTTTGVANSLVVRLDGSTLPLNPALVIVAGNDQRAASVLGAHFAIRGVVRPLANTTLGLNFASWGKEAEGRRYGGSADAAFNVGPININSTYAFSVLENQPFDLRAQATDIRARYGASGSPFAVGAYFLNISPNYGRAASASNDIPFLGAIGDYGFVDPNAVTGGINRYGVAGQFTVGAPLGLVLGAYYDSTASYIGRNQTNAFGVSAGIALLSSLRVTGFYNNWTYADGRSANALVAETQVAGTSPVIGAVRAPYSRGNNFGVALSHSGTLSDGNVPIIPGLDFDIGYANFNLIQTNDFTVSAQYRLGLGLITVTPFVRYHAYSGGGVGDYIGTNTFKYGAQVQTAANTLPFGLVLNGGAAARNTTYSDGGRATNEAFWRVTAQLPNILGAGTSFGVGYAGYTATGTSNGDFGGVLGRADNAFARTQDHIFADPRTSINSAFTATTFNRQGNANVNGVFAQFGYQGILFDYGLFRYSGSGFAVTPEAPVNPRNANSTWQQFRVSYTLSF